MAFRYGQGGRPKGAKNKNTDLHSICKKHGVNVFEEMLLIAKNTDDKKEALKFSRYSRIAEWLYARPKEVELSADQVRNYLESVTSNNDSTRSA